MAAKFFLIALLAYQCVGNPVPPNTSYDLEMAIEDLSYEITLTIKPDYLEKPSDFNFNGIATIKFKSANDIPSIRIHCEQFIAHFLIENTDKISLQIGNDPNKFINDANYNPTTEILTIPLTTNIKPGTEVILKIEFVGLFSKDLKGFYVSTYEDATGNELYVASTQFAPTYARRAFPCFDEPQYKGKFTIKLNHPQDFYAVSNGKATRGIANSDGMVETSFSESPLMSPYLVAFALHNMASTNVIQDKMNIYYPAKYQGSEIFAKNVSKNILEELNKFTNKNWDSVPNVVKMDQIVIPDFSGSATENWGLVTYKDAALLWKEENSGSSDMERVISTISHEFAHLWFGNLVTLRDWDYTWLNEGFATFFSHYIPDQLTKNKLIDQDFERMMQLPVIQQQTAFLTDGDSSAVSLNHQVKSPNEILSKFNEISYNKGASILHMMYHFLGEETFKTGFQKYIKDFGGTHVEPANFFGVFKPIDGTTMKNLMDPWVTLPGYPVVKVTLDANTNEIKFTQERFLYTKQTGGGQWNIPLTYEVRKDATTSANRIVSKQWLKTKDVTISKPVGWGEKSAIIVNIDETGYYRVNYDEVLWGRIKEVLDKDPTKISKQNRAQIVDDVLNLARADKITYDFAFKQIEFLENEINYNVWYSAFQSFSFLLKRLPDNSRDAMKNYLREYTARIYEIAYVIFPANHIQRLREELVWKWACDLENPTCIETADDLFAKIDEDPISYNDLRLLVYCSAIRQGGDAEWTKLYNKLANPILHPSEREIILTALGCTRCHDLLYTYLNTALKGEDIKAQDAYKVFEAVFSGNQENVDVVLQFLIENSKDISEKYNLNSVTKIINNLADRITTQAQLDEFTKFVNDKANNNLGDAQSVAEAALVTIQANLDWYDANEDEFMTFLNGYTTTTTVSTTTLGAAQATVSIILLTTLLIFGKLF